LVLHVSPGETSMELFEPVGVGFTWEAEMGSTTGQGAYGLVYRAGSGRGIIFAVSPDGYYGVFRLDGSEVEPLVDWRQFPHVRQGCEMNRLRVRCEGAICWFWINDEFAAQSNGENGPSGAIGIWARAYGVDASIQMTDARLWLD